MPNHNTPPHSPFDDDIVGAGDAAHNDDDDAPNLEAEDDDELIYLGDADEVLERWESELAADGQNDDDDDGDDEFLDSINEGDEGHDDGDDNMEPQRDDAAITFKRHTSSVFCGALHPTLDLAVTGGEDDRAYVWSTVTGDVVHEVTNHRDTIIGAAFSSDGNYVAIGDMAGELEVLKLSQDYKKVWEFSMGDMVWMQWHVATNVLMAGGQSGDVYVWRIPSGDCKVLAGNGQQSECGQLTADGKRLICGYADGSIRVWDIKTSSCVMTLEAGAPLAQTEAVTCLAADPDNGMWLAGSQDGTILVGASSGATNQWHPSAGPVEQLAFCPESDALKLVACGTLEGKVSLWDVAKQAVRVECERSDPSGVTRMLWAPGHNLLCATLSGTVKVFDGRTGALKQTLLGHRSDIYDMHYNKSKAQLLTTSDDNTAKLYTSFLL